MKNAVIFYSQITTEEDFSRFGNFIYKVLEQQELSDKECTDIKSIKTTGGMKAKRYCEYALLNVDSMYPIRKPQAICSMGDELSPIFVMEVREDHLPEIVQYKSLMLLEKFFREVEVYCIIRGTEEFYYKLSQYYSFCNSDEQIYNKVYYLTDGRRGSIYLKRLALGGEKNSSSFFALMLVNEENNNQLKENCENSLGKGVIEKLVGGEDVKENVVWEVLKGPVKLWKGNFKSWKEGEKLQIIRCLKDMDTLSFVLLSYSLKNFADLKRDIFLNEFRNYIELLKQYANACYQLLENIVFHSDSKWGIMSVRMHTSQDRNLRRYLIDKYNLYTGDNEPYFEIEICDYNGRQNGLNIAQNFYNKISNLEEREAFRQILPENLFRSSLEGKDRKNSAWKKFYSNPENMGKHFGLRIFQRIVSENQGKFIAESHQKYTVEKGESYHYRCEYIEKEEFCMPGTSYHMILPLNALQNQMLEKDITQEYGDWLRVNGDKIIRFRGKDIPTVHFEKYISQQKKNEVIVNTAKSYFENYESVEENVLFIDVKLYASGEAEIWAKSVVFALMRMKRKKHIVFYNCSDEFKSQVWVVLIEMFRNTGIEELFHSADIQIVLMAEDLEQLVFIPSSMEQTDNVNQYISHVKGIQCDRFALDRKNFYDMNKGKEEYIPFDVVEIDGKNSFFEDYIIRILNEDIQLDKLGCLIKDTHMRLGSTIHINNFYEAEILFGNKYFITRLAFLILKDCYEELLKEKKITLYGYASYSEALLVEVCYAIRDLIPGVDVDYIILEREEEKRGFSRFEQVEDGRKASDESRVILHTDRIRYNRRFENEEKREEYIAGRKFILIVPINSTLKTHERLISFLTEENKSLRDKEDWIMKNYAVLLVGSEGENNYWKKSESGDKVLKCKVDLKQDPRYFIEVTTNYQESLECNMCYPENPIDELPLIEVNAASTIPNQAFGLLKKEKFECSEKQIKDIIEKEMIELEVLKEHLLYGHIVRNENHYLYYISTGMLAQCQKNEIETSLKKWKQITRFDLENNEYHIIVAPMHSTNSVFTELVNEQIFSGMATILRIDFNKDYRSNVYVKYSNIRQYIRQLNDSAQNAKVKFHFVDDSIITGKTYWRAKSLVESLVESYREEYENVRMVIFDKIFILLDRNSNETKMQYVSKADRRVEELPREYYVFKQLEISSIRTYGDSCFVCNLKKEADLLNDTASTKIVQNYWERSNDKFSLKYVEKAALEKIKRGDEKQEERAFRRLFCTHIIKKVLEEFAHGNYSKHILVILLSIMRADYGFRAGETNAFEYFISYLKVMSRPFLVFQKATKEAVFDILLLIIETVLREDTMESIAKGSNKEYLKEKEVLLELKQFQHEILDGLEREQKRDLILLLMKQLCELKSNYIIRYKSMEALVKFNYEFFSKEIKTLEEEKSNNREKFFEQYAVLVKRLTGVSSDTSKSLWFDKRILENYNAYSSKNEEEVQQFLELLILENTRNFRDGIEKLYQKIKIDKKLEEQLVKYEESVIDKRYYRHLYLQIIEKERKLTEEELEECLPLWSKDNIAAYLLNCEVVQLKEHWLQKNSEEEWKKILNHIKRMNDNVKGYKEYIKIGKEIQSQFREIYNGEVVGYQYQNFARLLELMGVYDSEKQEISEEGYRQIMACVAVRHICDTFDSKDKEQKKVWKKIQILIRLLGEILEGIPVRLIMEVEGSSEYYKEVIAQNLANSKWNSLSEKSKIEISKHYEIIRQEGENSGNLLRLEKQIAEDMNSMEILSHLEKYGYALTEEKFIWEVDESGDFPIYLYAPFWKKVDNGMKLRIRNILMLSKELSNGVFGRKQLGYLQEVVNAKRHLKIYHREKAFNHTSDNVKKMQYRNIVESYRKPDTSSDEHQLYQSSNLRFLVDMNVSAIFRKSLYKEFYQSSVELSGMKWGDCENLLQGEHEIIIRQETNNHLIKVKIRNNPIVQGDSPVDDEDLLWTYANAENETILLLLALVLNVIKQENGHYRGIIESGHIEVNIAKTPQGSLRIANKENLKKGEINRVVENARECLQREPSGEESGISLWTVQAFIRRIISTFSNKFLEKSTDPNDISKLAILTGEEFGIKVNIYEKGTDNYFWYEIPILCQKYEEL